MDTSNNLYKLWYFVWLLTTPGIFQNLQAQIYHPDPYKFEGLWGVNMEFEKHEISENNISKVVLWKVILGKDSVTPVDSVLNYFIEFDQSNNPTKYHYEFSSSSESSKKVEKRRKRGELYIHVCHFKYDSKGELTHALETYSTAYARGAYSQNDIYNFFDLEGKLKEQKSEHKYIYPENPGFKRRKYNNDTNLTVVNINYDSYGNVIELYRSSSGYHFENNQQRDTIKYNSPFDSIFYKPPLHGVIKDTLGRIMQWVRYSTHLCGSGGCFSPESPHDRIFTHHYNSHGKLEKVHQETREGLWPEDEIRTYHENGLPDKIKKTGTNYIEVYEYVFRSN